MKNILVLIVALFFCNMLGGYAQQKDFDLLNADQLLKSAKKLSKKMSSRKARALCYVALNKVPDNDLARLFLAESYFKDDMLAHARQELKELQRRNPKLIAAYVLGANIEMSEEKYEEVLDYCVNGLKIQNNNEDLLMQKAHALLQLDRQEEAVNTLSTLLHVNPRHEDAKLLHKELTTIEYFNAVSVAYSMNLFNLSDIKEHFLTTELFKKWDLLAVRGRVNYAFRDGTDGGLYEVDVLPRIKDNTYALVNLGVGSKKVFPQFRIGGELFHHFTDLGLKGSFGLRHLRFTRTNYTYYTASAEKGFGGRVYLGVRGWLAVLFAGETNTALRAYARVPISGPSQFVQLEVGVGASPDNILDTANDMLFTKSQRIGIAFQQPLSQQFLLRLNGNLARHPSVSGSEETNLLRWNVGAQVNYLF